MFSLLATGCDLRLRVESGTNLSELNGFGVNFISDSATLTTGSASWEDRTATASEASTGLIRFSRLRYTPGARQLQVIRNNSLYMAPDFVEIGQDSVLFPGGFLTAGDSLRFHATYGLVNGTSDLIAQVNSKLNLQYDAVVGTASDVLNGAATHDSLNQAITDLPVGGKILLVATVTENVTLNKKATIQGKGHGTSVSGTFTLTSGADYSTVSNLRFGGNLTVNSTGTFIRDCYLAAAATMTEAGSAINSKTIIQE